MASMDPKVLADVRAAFPGAGTEKVVALGAPVHGGVVHPEPLVNIPLAMMNRHGLVAGATGTGKTKTLQLMAERLSAAGVPVFVSDVKGDVAGLAMPGTPGPKIDERAKQTGTSWQPRGVPVELFSLSGKLGAQLRATVSSFGPLALGKVLGLNDTQQSVLALVFKFCDDRGLPLLDFQDLRTVLNHLTSDEGAAALKDYGGISKASVAVLLREMVALEQQGAGIFFGEPELEIDDLLARDASGAGKVSILELADVQDKPALFSTFMMWMLAELYEQLPEVGDLDRPKLVFFFDEAHLLFRDASKAFLGEVEKVVRLVRSKGVGIFFVTQNPKDVPAEILAQLGNRVQHALRAFTPDDEKALRAAARTFPRTPHYEVQETLTSLGIGEALVTVLTERGTPTPPFVTRLAPPASRMAPLEPPELAPLLATEQVRRYARPIDRQSAHEILADRMGAPAGPARREDTEGIPDQPADEIDTDSYGEAPRPRGRRAPDRAPEGEGGGWGDLLQSPVGRTVAREVTRGILGALLGKRPRRRRTRGFFSLLAVLGGLSAAGEARAQSVSVSAARMVDVDSGKLVANPVIRIDKGIIVEVATRKAGQPVDHDLGDVTLVPGLADAHVHLTGGEELTPDEKRRETAARVALEGAANARKVLESGFTTVRDLSSRDLADVALRDLIARGRLSGPRMLVAVKAISATGGHGDDNALPPDIEVHRLKAVADGPAAVRAKVREHIKYGADWIKLMATGGVTSFATDPRQVDYTEEELRAAVEAGREKGRDVAVHAHGTLGILRAARAGARSIEHASMLDEASVAAVRKSGSFLVMNPVTNVIMIERGRAGGYTADQLRKADDVWKLKMASLRMAVKARLPLAYGTDSGVQAHGTNARQLGIYVEAGMTPLEALRSATTVNARLLRMEGKIGRLARGHFGDVVAVKGDPLGNVRLLEKPVFVMKEGVVVVDRVSGKSGTVAAASPAAPAPSGDAAIERLCPRCKRIFDGKSWDGWQHDPRNWSLVGGAMRGFGKGERSAYTADDYGSFRLIVTSRMAPVNGDHLGVLFWGPRPPAGSISYNKNLQVQPPHGAMWDYFENKNLQRETVAPGTRDFESWNTMELLADLKTGTVRVAVDGREISRYRDKDPKRLQAGPIGMQRHGGGGSEYRDIFVEKDPVDRRLLTVEPGATASN